MTLHNSATEIIGKLTQNSTIKYSDKKLLAYARKLIILAILTFREQICAEESVVLAFLQMQMATDFKTFQSLHSTGQIDIRSTEYLANTWLLTRELADKIADTSRQVHRHFLVTHG